MRLGDRVRPIRAFSRLLAIAGLFPAVSHGFAEASAWCLPIVRAHPLQVAQVFSLSNAERAKAGVPKLRWNPVLAESARLKAAEMARLQYVAHADAQGGFFDTRTLRLGYQFRHIGENIAGGFESAPEVLEAWMRSVEHQRTLLSPKFTEIGIALVYAPRTRHGYYWVQVLGRQLSEAEPP